MRAVFCVMSITTVVIQLLAIWKSGFMEFIVPSFIKSKSGTDTNDFINVWERFLFDWKSLLRPCQGRNHNRRWLSRSSQRDGETFVNKTRVVSLGLKVAGLWSTITFQTYFEDGTEKGVGGDSWRAVLRGNYTLIGVVSDRMDGKYDVVFLPKRAGTFVLELTLEYSRCGGVKDPPHGWFEKGDIHGHFQEQGVLNVDPQPSLQSIVVQYFYIRESNQEKVNIARNAQFRNSREVCANTSQELSMHRKCKILLNSIGHWENTLGGYVWKGCYKAKPNLVYPKSKLFNKLWIFGDSIAYRWWVSDSRDALCKRLFASCTYTYTFTYEYEHYNYSKVDIGEGFNLKRFFKPIRRMFNDSDMKKDSVIVINLGIHLIISVNFSTYQLVIDTFVGMIEDLRLTKGQNALPMIIWKTTTFSSTDRGMFQGKSHMRFLTNHRIRLFNAYANSRLCSANVHIFDVYALTASYPGRSKDGLHYEDHVFSSAEQALESFLIENAPSNGIA